MLITRELGIVLRHMVHRAHTQRVDCRVFYLHRALYHFFPSLTFACHVAKAANPGKTAGNDIIKMHPSRGGLKSQVGSFRRAFLGEKHDALQLQQADRGR